MKSRGKIVPLMGIQVRPISKNDMKSNLLRWGKEEKPVNITITFTAKISQIAAGGMVYLDAVPGEDAVCIMETWYKKRTITQISTLKALEAFLYWSQEGDYPQKSDQLWAIHEGIIEEADIRDPETGARIRTSSPICTTQNMNRFIEIALNHLAQSEINDDLKDRLTDQKLSTLFTTWIQQRMIDKDIDNIKNWDEYKERFQFCEATFQHRDDLVQAHIVSRGANAAVIDEPWNWLRIRNDIHQLQHQNGWDGILAEFPHLRAKVERARNMASLKDSE